MRTSSSRRAIRVVTTAVAAVGLVALGALPAEAAGNGADPRLRVMTQNLYLGSSLAPALTATDQTGFLIGVTTIWQTVQFTDFPARAKAIADEIDAKDPDVIGLQEVSKWTPVGPGAPPGLDFLAILQAELAARGLSYAVAGVSDNASVGPVPIICDFTTPALCTWGLLFQDRDVILVNSARHDLHTWGATSGSYVAQQVLATPVGPLSFDRGWVSVQGSLAGKKFRFVTTHLEVEDFPAVQEAQGAEFLAGPAAAGGRVIAVGDFNSAADGSTTTTFASLTAQLKDAWRVNPKASGVSCCQDGTLTNATSALASRIDLILSRGAVKTRWATLVGNAPFQATPPLWPSDHAGVFAVLVLR